MANVIQIVIKQTSSGNAIPTVTKQLGGLDKAAGSSGGAFSKLGSIMSGVFTGAAANIVGNLFEKLAGGLTKVAMTGLGFNNAMEQAAARINAFTKDAGLTADILETVRDRAAKTPFAFEEMANAAAALMPTMRASGESLEFLLEKAEILAASNPMEGLEGASFALKEAVSGDFTSIIERFNLSRSTLNQLKAQGVPALEAVGMAMAELGLDTDLVTALAETAEGRWSTFKDTLTTMAGTVTQPIFDRFSQGLGNVNAWLVQIGPQLQEFATMLAENVAGAIEAVVTSISKIFEAYQRFGARGATVSILGQLGLDPTQIAGVMGAADQVVEVISKIKGAFDRFGAKGAAVSILGMLGLSPETIGQLRSAIDATIPYITEQFTNLSAVLAPVMASFQESFARLQETFPQLNVSFGELGININSIAQFLLMQAEFILGTVIPAWIQWIGFLTGVAASAFSAWVTYIQGAYAAFQSLSGFIQTSVIPTLLAINEKITVVTQVLAALGGLVSAIVNKALQAMAGLWQNVLQPALIKVGDTLNKVLFPIFQSIGKTVKDDVSPPLQDLAETVMPLLQEGMDFVSEAIKRAIGYFNSLKDAVNSFTLPDILTPGSPPPMATAMMDIANATSAANQAVSGMLNSLASSKWSQIRGEVFDLVDDMQDEGFYASRGFGKSTGFAIKQAFLRAFTANFQGILSGTVSGDVLLALTRNEAGAYAERVTGDFGKIVARARQAGIALLVELKQELLEALPSAAGGFSGIAGTFAGMLNEQIGSLETARKKVEELTKAQIKNAEFVGKTDEEFQKNTEAIAKNNAEFEAMRSTRAGMIALLEQFLKGGSEELFKFDFAPALVGVDHVMMDRLQVQEQLNFLLAEQQEQEAAITKQKEAQQKLTFLQAQVDLIKLGQGLGGNLFEGITFGLNASVEDLLAATNNVVEAMVQQIDTTLGIASPSKVLFDKFKNQVGGAMVGGLLAARPMLGSVAGAMLDPLTGGGVTNNRTTNNYFNQTVNTRAESSTVIGDFRSLQLMAGT